MTIKPADATIAHPIRAQPLGYPAIPTRTIVLSVAGAIPIAIISIPLRLLWMLVILTKCFYLFILSRRMEAANALECFWKNSLTLILLPFRVFSFLSPVRRNVAGLASHVDLTNVDFADRANIPKEFTPARVSLIGAAARFSASIWNFTGTSNPTTWPAMDGATCLEMAHDFTRGEAAQAGIIDPHPEDSRPIRLLLVGIRGTRNRMEVLECIYQFFGGRAENFAPIEAFTEEVLGKISERNANLSKFRYVPVVVGHSMGGAFASAIAIKQGISSITFNSMGWGAEFYKMVGEDAIRRAETADLSTNINLSVAGCHVSDPGAFIFQRTPGKTFHLPNCTELENIHMSHDRTWGAFCANVKLPGMEAG
jgi:hypothetical protein